MSDINPAVESRRGQSDDERFEESRIGTKTDAELDFVVAKSEKLPFEDESINQYMIAFGLRNVTNIDIAERSTSSLEERRRISI